jgi:excisionase family DNA binding protein
MQKENETFYTGPELAAMYRVTRQSIWNWIREGRLPAIRLGSAYRVSETDWRIFVGQKQK